MEQYFLTVRFPLVVLGGDCLEGVGDPKPSHEEEPRVFYRTSHVLVAEGLLDVLRAKEAGGPETIFDIDTGLEDWKQRVLFRQQIDLLASIASLGDWDPGVWKEAGYPSDQRTRLLVSYYRKAEELEPLVRDELADDICPPQPMHPPLITNTVTDEVSPREKAEAFLSSLVLALTEYEDQEALVYSARRGKDCRDAIVGMTQQWKQWREATAAIAARTGRLLLPAFGADGTNNLVIAATMMRVSDTCRIGGFEDWWEHSAQDLRHEISSLGVPAYANEDALSAFALLRSDTALTLMGDTLSHYLLALRTSYTHQDQDTPWLLVGKDAKGNEVVEHSVALAATLVFGADRLGGSWISPSLRRASAEFLLSSQHSQGFWSRSHTETAGETPNEPEQVKIIKPGIELTAMAIHALSLAKPYGYQNAVDLATRWLWSQQSEQGQWHEDGSPGDAFLTVLVLDAIDLAENRPDLTFVLHGNVDPRTQTTTACQPLCRRLENAVTQEGLYGGQVAGMEWVVPALEQAQGNPLGMGDDDVGKLTDIFYIESDRLELGDPVCIEANILQRWRERQQEEQEHERQGLHVWFPWSTMLCVGHALKVIALDRNLGGGVEIEVYADDLAKGRLDSPHRAAAHAAVWRIEEDLNLRRLREWAKQTREFEEQMRRLAEQTDNGGVAHPFNPECKTPVLVDSATTEAIRVFIDDWSMERPDWGAVDAQLRAWGYSPTDIRRLSTEQVRCVFAHAARAPIQVVAGEEVLRTTTAHVVKVDGGDEGDDTVDAPGACATASAVQASHDRTDWGPQPLRPEVAQTQEVGAAAGYAMAAADGNGPGPLAPEERANSMATRKTPPPKRRKPASGEGGQNPADERFARQLQLHRERYENAVTAEGLYGENIVPLLATLRDNPLALERGKVATLIFVFGVECGRLRKGEPVSLLASDLRRFREEVLPRESDGEVVFTLRPLSLVEIMGEALTVIGMDMGVPGAEEVAKLAGDRVAIWQGRPNRPAAWAALEAILRNAELRDMQERRAEQASKDSQGQIAPDDERIAGDIRRAAGILDAEMRPGKPDAPLPAEGPGGSGPSLPGEQAPPVVVGRVQEDGGGHLEGTDELCAKADATVPETQDTLANCGYGWRVVSPPELDAEVHTITEARARLRWLCQDMIMRLQMDPEEFLDLPPHLGEAGRLAVALGFLSPPIQRTQWTPESAIIEPDVGWKWPGPAKWDRLADKMPRRSLMEGYRLHDPVRGMPKDVILCELCDAPEGGGKLVDAGGGQAARDIAARVIGVLQLWVSYIEGLPAVPAGADELCAKAAEGGAVDGTTGVPGTRSTTSPAQASPDCTLPPDAPLPAEGPDGSGPSLSGEQAPAIVVDLVQRDDGWHWVVGSNDTGRLPKGTLTTWSQVLFKYIALGDYTSHAVFKEAMGVTDDQAYWSSHKQNRSKLSNLIEFAYDKKRGMRLSLRFVKAK